MKPNLSIAPGLFSNEACFQDPFFKRFQLRHASKPLELTAGISKDYLFPTLYADVTCAIAIFFCDWAKAAAVMPHPAMKPVKMLKGRSLVIFSCYEYKNVLGIPPYNEIAMTIPVMVDPGANIPVLPMVLGGAFRHFGYYVFSMPVTSLENQIRGRKIWGLPKVVQEIGIREENGACVTRVHEESGEPYFELRVPTAGKPVLFDVRSNLYSRLGNELLQSQTNFRGTFAMAKNMGLLFKGREEPATPALWLGDTPSGRAIQALDIHPAPFQFRFARGMTSCFDLPNPDYRPPAP